MNPNTNTTNLPAKASIVQRLLEEKHITAEEAVVLLQEYQQIPPPLPTFPMPPYYPPYTPSLPFTPYVYTVECKTK
jgi:hypothetical protein